MFARVLIAHPAPNPKQGNSYLDTMKWLSLKKHSQSEMSWEKAVNAQPSIVLTPYVTRPLVLSFQVVFWMYSGYEQLSPPSNGYNMLLEKEQEKVNQFNPFRTARQQSTVTKDDH